MSFANLLSALKDRFFLRTNANRRRSSKSRPRFTPQFIQLEDRCLLSFTPVLVNGPVGNPVTSLDQVVATPYYLNQSTGAVTPLQSKLVTVMNNSPYVVYPIFTDANSTADPSTEGNVVSLTIASGTGGTGYSAANPPIVDIAAPGGASVKATAKAIVVDGSVVGFQMIETGSGYTSAPTVTITSQNGGSGLGTITAHIPNGASPSALYDPLDPLNQGYRGYIGEYNPMSGQVEAGLQPYHQVTIQIPLAFWDGARLTFVSNGSNPLSGPNDPSNPIQDDSAGAKVWQMLPTAPAFMPHGSAGPLAPPPKNTPYSATFDDPSTGVSNPNGMILWYHDMNSAKAGPKGFGADAPGQLSEFTIRDTTQVRLAPNMPSTELANNIFNYDVSYVDTLSLPASMETTDGFVKTNPELGTAPYANVGADLSYQQMQQALANFTQNSGGILNPDLGTYFNGLGYTSYTLPNSSTLPNPGTNNLIQVPGGYNVIAQSAPADAESSFNPPGQSVDFLLTSGGSVARVASNAALNHNGKLNPGTANANKITDLDPSVISRLAVGMLVNNSAPTGSGALVTAAIANGGSGYHAGDVLTIQGGTGTSPIATQLTVSSVNASGVITGVSVTRNGSYTTVPTNPATVTGGTGTGATFTLTFPPATGPYFSQPTYITAIDPTTNTVTVSTPAIVGNDQTNPGETYSLTFTGSKWTSVNLGSTDGITAKITGIDPNVGQYLSPGMVVTGAGIPASTYALIGQLIRGPAVTSALTANGGSGYAVNDVLTVVGGTGTAATLTVTSVSTTGAVTGISLTTAGSYTAFPANPASVTGGTGTGATFNLGSQVIGVTLVDQNNAPVIPSAQTNQTYTFSSAPSSYLASTLVNNWYSWADFYVSSVASVPAGMFSGTMVAPKFDKNGEPEDNSVWLTLTNMSQAQIDQLAVGDVVSGGFIVPGDPSNTTYNTFTSIAGFETTSAGVRTGKIKLNAPIIPPASAGIAPGTTYTKTDYAFSLPRSIVRSSDAQPHTLDFTAAYKNNPAYGEDPVAFARTVYDVMNGFSRLPPTTGDLSASLQLLANCIGCSIGAFDPKSTTYLTGNLLPVIRQTDLRDELKSVLRGVSDFTAYAEFGNAQKAFSTSQWYPAPAVPVVDTASGAPGSLINGQAASFNVFNLNPYVWFIHRVLGMNGYGFSVDDDTADVGSLGSNLQVAFGGSAQTAPLTPYQTQNGQTKPNSLSNLNYYTTGLPYGPLVALGHVDVQSGFAQGILNNPPPPPYLPANNGGLPLAMPTVVAARVVAADATTVGALVTVATTTGGTAPAGYTLQPGTRVVGNQAIVTGEPIFYPNPYPNQLYVPNGPTGHPTGEVTVNFQTPNGQKGNLPSVNGPDLLYTFAGFNTLLPGTVFATANISLGVSPNNGPVGTLVTITGTNFAYLLATGQLGSAILSVTFNGIPAIYNVINATSLTVTVPVGATTGKIAIRSAAGTSYSALDFTVGGAAAAPTLASASPNQGSLGVPVTLTGTGFTGVTGVTFNGKQASSVTFVSDSTIIAVVPAGATTGQIVVNTPAGNSVEVVNYTVNAPSNPTFNPTHGVAGTVITLTGTGFTYASAVTFNGIAAASYTVVNDTKILATVPTGVPTPATVAIAVTTSGGTGTSAATFVVDTTVAPTINASTPFSPTSGVPGTLVTINGSGFTGATNVTIANIPVSFTVVDDNTITATVPQAAPTSGLIAVSNLVGTGDSSGSTPSQFSITAAHFPTVLSFDPPTGPAGQGFLVTLSGTGFTGATAVTFNGTSALFSVVDDTKITTFVPAGATTGTIAVTNSAGTGFSQSAFVVGPVGPPVFTTPATATFPVYSVSATSTSTSTNLAVTGANVAQLSTGMFVSGPGIAPGTTITVTGTTVTLSTAAGAGAGTGNFVFSGSSFTVKASGANTLKVVGDLPLSVTFTDNGNGTATLAGAPNFDTGNFVFQIVATNTAANKSTTQTFTLDVASPPRITTTINNVPQTSGTFTVGVAIPANQVIKVTATSPAGVNLPITNFAVTGLPMGLVFSPATGIIGGTAQVNSSGVYPVSITASNATGSTTVVFTVTVTAAKPTFVTPATTTFTVGKASTFIVRATGFPTLPTVTTAVAMPTGVTFTSVPNVVGLSGTSTLGSSTMTVASGAGIVVGMGVIGPGIANGATVTAISGTTVTLSTAALSGAGAGSFSFGGIATITSTVGAVVGKIFVITATVGATSTNQTFTLNLVKPALAITSQNRVAFQEGQLGSFTVMATGFPVPAITKNAAALPAGVNFTDNGNGTATISGTPAGGTAGQNFTITLTATLSPTVKVSQVFVLGVVKYTAPSVPVATFTAGVAGAQTIPGTFPVGTTFTVTNGKLPAGLVLTRATNGSITVSGTPPAGSGGAYSFRILSNNSQTALSPVYTINVNQAQPIITSVNKATFAVGTAATFNITTSGFPFATISFAKGSLPNGLVLTANNNGTATISGTPQAGAGGIYTLVINADNGSGIAQQIFTLTVTESPQIISAPSDTFTRNVLNSFTVQATGFPIPMLITSGLPAGITLVNKGNGIAILQGKPTAASGTVFRFFITAISGSLVEVQEFTLTVV